MLKVFLQLVSSLIGVAISVLVFHFSGVLLFPLADALEYSALYYGIPLFLTCIPVFYIAKFFFERKKLFELNKKSIFYVGLYQGFLIHPFAHLVAGSKIMLALDASNHKELVFVAGLLAIALFGGFLSSVMVSFLYRFLKLTTTESIV